MLLSSRLIYGLLRIVEYLYLLVVYLSGGRVNCGGLVMSDACCWSIRYCCCVVVVAAGAYEVDASVVAVVVVVGRGVFAVVVAVDDDDDVDCC